MGSISDGLAITRWITERIEQASKFFKKRNRLNRVKKHKEIVELNSATGDALLDDELQRIRRAAEDRKNAS